MISEALDIAIIALLLLAMVYGYRLHKKISIIQDSRKELGEMFKIFDQTIIKANTSVEDLKYISQEIAKELQDRIDKGKLLIDDISFVAERAEKRIVAMQNDLKEVENLRMSSSFANLPSDKNLSRNKKPAVNNNKKPQEVVKRQKDLESLLNKISEQREKQNSELLAKQKINRQAQNSKSKSDISAEKRDDIASVLKALGYGES